MVGLAALCSAALVAAAPGFPAATAAGPTASTRTTITPSDRVAGMISEMTLAEKISFIRPATDPQKLGQAGYIPGVPRLGIPELRLTDGPAGVRLPQPTTALPVPVSLASSWSPALAREYGQVIAREGRALGQDVILSPMVNAIRIPQGGRNYEMFSEDPLLTSEIAASQIGGIVGEDGIATVKHYALNNQETNRSNVSAEVDDQTLHEIELPGFAAAVDAGAGSVMCAYNKVNGVYSCGNDELLNGVLKDELGFQGWVMSDWGATHAASDLSNGLDQEMHWVGQQKSYFAAMADEIAAGRVLESDLDDAVARILGQMEKVGLLDGAGSRRPTLDLSAGELVAQRVAEEGSVLLKNERAALPLTTASGSIGLIGPTAKKPKVAGGGSANVKPAFAASPLDTITARAGSDNTVTWSTGIAVQGNPIPASALSPSAPFADDGEVDMPLSGFRYSGTLTITTPGTYSFMIDAGNAYATLSIDGKGVGASILEPVTGTIELEAGAHSLSVFSLAVSGTPSTIRIGWVTPEAAAAAQAEAVALATSVTTPIVFAYDDATATADRPNLNLPGGQDELISAVAQANPNTVVVLNTGSAVTMPWIDDVAAVLDTYYPGQNGAQATTRLLFGDVNPSGKLTQTFPASIDETPVADDPNAFPGVDGKVQITEGIDAGYRWYQRNRVEPLFPFGYGLSYTTFAYRGFNAHQRGDVVTVRVKVANTGSRSGQEVVQVYAGPSRNLTLAQPLRKLVGFTKVNLAAGEVKNVEIQIDLHQLESWNTTTNSWELGTGARKLWVGGSSADLPQTTTVRIDRPSRR